MRKNIVAGNWKMNKNLQEGIALAKELNEALTADKPNCDVVICTPFIHLASVTPSVDAAIRPQYFSAVQRQKAQSPGISELKNISSYRLSYIKKV